MLQPVIRDHTAPAWQDEGRRRLRKGAAFQARQMRDTGHGVGHGLKAEALMRGTGATNLSRMAVGMKPVAVTKPTARWCKACRDAGREAFQPLDHDCVAR